MRLIFLSCLFLLSSCATLFSDSNDTIEFTSEPSGAQVFINGKLVGKTPLKEDVRRSTFDTAKVVIRHPNFKPHSFTLNKTLTTAAIFNLSSVLSWATDATTGKAFKYSPNSYFIDLSNPATGSVIENSAFRFVMVNHSKIINELSTEPGEYWTNLKDLLEWSDVDAQEKYNSLRSNIQSLPSYPNDFFNQLIANK